MTVVRRDETVRRWSGVGGEWPDGCWHHGMAWRQQLSISGVAWWCVAAAWQKIRQPSCNNNVRKLYYIYGKERLYLTVAW